MEILGLFSNASLVEWLIFGFIGANMTLSGVFLVQRGVKRLASNND